MRPRPWSGGGDDDRRAGLDLGAIDVDIDALDPLFHWVLSAGRDALADAGASGPRAGAGMGNPSFPPPAVTLPGGPYAVEPADWYLIGGDESALPAIETILEELPDASQAQVIVEVGKPDEERELSTPHVTWLSAETYSPSATSRTPLPSATRRPRPR